VDNHFSLDNKWNFLLDDERHLHFNRFHFCFVNEYLLILDTISVCFNWHFLDDLNRDSSLSLNLNTFLLCYDSFHYLLDFDCLDFFLFTDDWSIHKYLNGHLYLLDDNLRNWNFNDLKNWLINYHYFLDYFRYLYYLLDNTRNYNNFLYYLLYLYNSWHFYNFLDDSVNELLLNFDNFLFDDDGYWLINMNGFYYFLFSRHNLYFLYFDFFYLLRHTRHIDFIYDGHLLSNVEWNYFFNLDVFSDKNFLNDWLVNKYFDLSDRFFFISLDEVWTLNEQLFRYLSYYFFLYFQFSIYWFFNSIG
jgi:hypothetical protein